MKKREKLEKLSAKRSAKVKQTKQDTTGPQPVEGRVLRGDAASLRLVPVRTEENSVKHVVKANSCGQLGAGFCAPPPIYVKVLTLYLEAGSLLLSLS